MSGLNQCAIIGNLGRDAEMKDTRSGPVLSMSVAVSERVKRGDSWEEETTWFRAAVFGKRADALAKLNLSKGTKVYVSGPVKAQAYSKDGEARASLDIIAREIVLLGGGSGGGQRQQHTQRKAESYGTSGTGYQDAGADFGDDDVPFLPVDERAH